MGNLVEGRTEDFPVESRSGGINYIVIDFDSSDWNHYKSTKTEKEKLLNYLEESENKQNITVLGVWKGRHRSDTFLLETDALLQKMKNSEL